MEMPTVMQPVDYEHKIVEIVRKLPPERSSQVLAFARFVAYETFQPNMLDFLEEDELMEIESAQHDAKWEALFASEAGQNTLDRLADEALSAIRAGQTRPIAFTV
jgi:hypothetical protein